MQDNFEIRIVSFLDRTMTDEDKKSFEAELANDENKKKLFYEMKDIWDSSSTCIPDTETELKEFRIKHAIAGGSEIPRERKKYLYATLRIAAVLILGIIIGRVIIPVDKEPVFNTVSVPRGSKSTITLSDGSRVILNSGSTFTYPSVFNNDAREVEIDGEGYFYVTHNPGRPFIVKTAIYDIKVLGTEFNVFAYNDFSNITTSLVNGSIEIVTLGNQATVLEPGQKITYLKNDDRYIVAKADISHDASWKDDVFSFVDEQINDFVKRLELWYDVEIDISPEANTDASFTGKFRNHETIYQALDAINATTGISYERIGFRHFRLSYDTK